MKYHDGTRPMDFSNVDMDPEKLKWLEQVLQKYVHDFNDRMREIKDVFDSGEENIPSSVDEKAALLEELQEIVESIDYAKNLQQIGGLSMLLELLESPHPRLRWRAAEVVATCVQNNPSVQKSFKAGGVLPPLMALLTDEDMTCQQKAVLAISGLIRNFPEGENEFMEAGGMRSLLDALRSKNLKLQWRALFLFRYLLSKSAAHRKAFREAGVVPLFAELLTSSDINARESALHVMLIIAQDQEGTDALKQEGNLKKVLLHRKQELSKLTGEHMEMVAEELQMMLELIGALS